MSAKLEWKGEELMLGPWRLGRLGYDMNTIIPIVTRWPLTDVAMTPRETASDAMQDLESEVWRLLKEAGVEVDP